jgi:ribosomal protein L44E
MKMYIGLHVKYPLCLLLFLLIFENHLNIKFDENRSSGSRVVSCGQRDMTRLIVAFRSFANVSQNGQKKKKNMPEFNFSCKNCIKNYIKLSQKVYNT